MSAKLTFNDIENAELDVSKLNFDAGFSGSLASGIIDPSADSPVGALYINTASGTLFRKTASGGANWTSISSITSTVLVNRYRASVHNSSLSSEQPGEQAAFGDLVGYHGLNSGGVQSAVMTATRTDFVAAGSGAAAFAAGGRTQASAETFNGTVWTASGSLNIARYRMAGGGTQNAGYVAGGSTSTSLTSNGMELFNGSVWTAGSGTLLSARYFTGGAGTMCAGLVIGGITSIASTDVPGNSEFFNGIVWSLQGNMTRPRYAGAGGGSANAAVYVAGSITTANVVAFVDIYNGSAWAASGNLNFSRANNCYAGSLYSGLCFEGDAGGSSTGQAEFFNGSSWSINSGFNINRRQASAFGGSNEGFIAGGYTGGVTIATRSVEKQTQTTYKKMYTKNLAESKSIGVLSGTNTVVWQGTITTTVYPANKYLILNRYQNSSATSSLLFLSVGSVQGVAPTMTYNLSTTAILTCVVPGNIVVIQGGGGTPISGANVGSFVVSRVISPSSFEISNASGVAQNPGTGFASILSSMLAVDYIGPQDIVVGKTDNNGLLTIPKPIIIGSVFRRLK